MIVRRLGPDEAPLLRALRLRALADAPGAFAHSHAETSVKPDAYWAEMTRSLTEPDRHVMFVAEDGAGPVGMVFGLIGREQPALAHLGGMWVAPAARGQGVGRTLAATGCRDRLPGDDRLEIIEMRLSLSTRTP